MEMCTITNAVEKAFHVALECRAWRGPRALVVAMRLGRACARVPGGARFALRFQTRPVW